MNTAGHQQIQFRAYQLWEERGHPWGTPDVDWFRAEAELAPESEAGLLKLAREIGHALGTAVSLLADPAHHAAD